MKNLRRLPFFKMFAPKRKSRGTMWASLIGLGLSAAVFGLSRGKGKGKNFALPFQDVVKNFSTKPKLNLNNAAITEFSDELLESALGNNPNKQ